MWQGSQTGSAGLSLSTVLILKKVMRNDPAGRVFSVLAALLSRWLSAQEGVTVINWLGWRVEVMTSLLIAGLALGLGCCFCCSG